MTLSTLAAFVRLELWVLLGLLLFVVLYQMFTGQVKLTGLLYDSYGERSYSPMRVQMLLLSVSGALYYFSTVLNQPTHFPEVPEELLAAVGGSQALYLGGKSSPMLRRWLNQARNRT